MIHKKVRSNNGRMPYGYMTTFLEENKKSFDWLTRYIVNSSYTCVKKGRLEKSSVQRKATINVIHIDQPMDAGNSSQISDLSESLQLDSGSLLRANQ